jgi:hypothetical protein
MPTAACCAEFAVLCWIDWLATEMVQQLCHVTNCSRRGSLGTNFLELDQRRLSRSLHARLRHRNSLLCCDCGHLSLFGRSAVLATRSSAPDPVMTDKLPPNLLALFTARPPLRWVPPCDTEPSQRKTPAITPVAPALAQAKEVDEKYKHLEHPPTESWLEKRDRIKLEKEKKLQHLRNEGRDECMSSHFTIVAAQHGAWANSYSSTVKPNDDPNIKGDPLRTLFVGRLSYEATEDDLRKAFGQFGRIQSVRLIQINIDCTKANNLSR